MKLLSCECHRNGDHCNMTGLGHNELIFHRQIHVLEEQSYFFETEDALPQLGFGLHTYRQDKGMVGNINKKVCSNSLIHIPNEQSVLVCINFNTLRPRQNGCYFPDDIFKCIFLNENVWISIQISLKFVPEGPVNNIPALVQIWTNGCYITDAYMYHLASMS